MSILKDVCSLPTAPFVEHRVIAYVKQFARDRGLKFSQDEFGNVLLERPGTKRQPRWVFTAHMDHPGFVSRSMIDATTLKAEFRGWVMAEYLPRQKVLFFDGQREIAGVVISASAEKKTGRARDAIIRVKGPVSPGCAGMFDQGEGRAKGRRFFSRACDDVAGAAAALEMLHRLGRRATRAPVAVLLTRAEEDGFIGATGAASHPHLLRKDDRLITIECSAMQPYAKQNDGVIIRVGDKASIFNSSLTYFIAHQAQKLAKSKKTVKYQRALMPGGTCEATVFDVYGFTAAAVCVPLGNYHNMNREKKKIGPEYISLRDWESMVQLFMQLIKTAHEYHPGNALLKQRIDKRFDQRRALLK